MRRTVCDQIEIFVLPESTAEQQGIFVDTGILHGVDSICFLLWQPGQPLDFFKGEGWHCANQFIGAENFSIAAGHFHACFCLLNFGDAMLP